MKKTKLDFKLRDLVSYKGIICVVTGVGDKSYDLKEEFGKVDYKNVPKANVSLINKKQLDYHNKHSFFQYRFA